MITPEEVYIKNLNKRVKVNSNKEIDYQHYLAIIDSIIEYNNIKVNELLQQTETHDINNLLIDFYKYIEGNRNNGSCLTYKQEVDKFLANKH